MKTPHVHAQFIKAWADGEQIEHYNQFTNEWGPIGSEPCWFPSIQFRIKPEPKPDVVYYGVFDRNGDGVFLDAAFTRLNDVGDQIKITFDGETGKLKKAEVL